MNEISFEMAKDMGLIKMTDRHLGLMDGTYPFESFAGAERRREIAEVGYSFELDKYMERIKAGNLFVYLHGEKLRVR